MKQKINKFIDWFESKFNFIVDIIALIGGIFLILFGIFLFVVLVLNVEIQDLNLDIIYLPGVMGFFGIVVLFALRITRHLTKKE